jgi:branched-chain amino acid transport system ATP-binding protein
VAEPVLELTDLSVVYTGGVQGLVSLSLKVPPGSVVSLLGSNGAGKSTTLKAISNLLPFEGGKVAQGAIRFEGRDIVGIPAHRLARSGLLHVREGRRVFPTMTVQENLVAASYALNGRAPLNLKERCDDIYTLFPHLERRKALLAGFLSGGEQQMLAIGRALVGEPKLMLIDEASLGLAPVIAADIFNTITKINRERGISVLLVEQNATLALKHSSYGYVIDNGRVVIEGPSGDLRKNPTVIERYMGGSAETTKAIMPA